jgi:phage-related protein
LVKMWDWNLFFFSLCLSHVLFLLFVSCFPLYTHTMDDYRCKRLVFLVFIMAMHPLIAQVVSLQRVVIGQHWGRVREFIYLFLNCWHAIKRLEHMEVWEGIWIHEK